MRVITESEVTTLSGCKRVFDCLLNMSDSELELQDIALVNLVCAAGLPGTESLDVPQCLQTIQRWTEHVRKETETGFPRYRANPDPNKGSEAVYRLWVVMYALRHGMGLTHIMTAERIRERSTAPTPNSDGPYQRAANPDAIFIHGLFGKRRIGSCSSMPVLFAAVGRRLGYPVKLVLSVQHIFNRWVDETESFNMDGSAKFIAGDDYEHYLDWPRPWLVSERTSGVFLRPATPREELAAFVFMRCIVWSANLEFEQARRECQLACRLSPEHPGYRNELEVIDRYRRTKRSRAEFDWVAAPPIVSLQPPLGWM